MGHRIIALPFPAYNREADTMTSLAGSITGNVALSPVNEYPPEGPT